jgi:hypothetical protein
MDLKHSVNRLYGKSRRQIKLALLYSKQTIEPEVPKGYSQAVAKLSPLLSNVCGRIFDKVDSVAASILRREVELLNEHPNVAMLLSQGTVLKMAAAKAYERTAVDVARNVIVNLGD